MKKDDFQHWPVKKLFAEIYFEVIINVEAFSLGDEKMISLNNYLICKLNYLFPAKLTTLKSKIPPKGIIDSLIEQNK